MPSDLFLEIFAEEHALYRAHKAAWAREERRLFGGDAVLPELAQWKGETDDFYAVRTASASYLELPHKHASILVGHLRRKAPPLNYGTGMGEVRARDKITRPTLSELFDYNCDGVGSDGSQLAAWLDGLQERACATGHRYVLVDMPDQATLRAIRRAGDRAEVGPVTFQDQVEGFRPYLVEYSPLAVPNWEETKGVLQWAVLRVPVSPAKVVDDQGRRARTATEPGYLVLVRKGYQGLGAKHQNGGWWLFDAERNLVPEGSAEWKDTRGQIPLLKLVAESSRGTHHRPALSRSLTMQLGQLDVGLMNLRSTRDYNLIQAGKSITFGLGVNSDVHKAVITQLDTGSLFVSVPLSSGTDGRGIAPSLWNSSEAAQASTAFKAVIDSTLVEAREIMVRQVMGEEGASGVSKEAEFNATNSPLLARLAATREQFENTLLYFVALRFEREPNGSVVWPREFPIRDLVDDIDAMLDTIRKAQLSSPTLEKKLVLKKAETLGLLGDEAERKTIEAELEQAIADKQARKEQEASLFGDLSDAARDGRPVPVPTPTA